MLVYGNGRLRWPDHTHRARLATALVAFLPQFNFLHASVSNDSLVIFLASAALISAMRVGDDAQLANVDLQKQAQEIVEGLKADGIEASEAQEIIALIAYLQRLGTDIKVTAENK